VRPLRVLHVPDSVGGHAPGLARAERELGLDSISVVLRPSPFAYAADEVVGPPGTSRAVYERRRLQLVLRALRDFDVVHFNFGRTLLPSWLHGLDLPVLRRAGKTIFVTFQGDDVRQGAPARTRGGASLPTALPSLYPAEADAERRRRVARFERWADGIFYLNPDLAHVLPARARFVPYAHVDPRIWLPRPRDSARRPVVVHAPSDPIVKGTDRIVDAVGALQAEGLDFEFRLVRGLPHDEARAIYEDADVAIDQLYAGWYGGVAVELMALGVPVLSFIRQDDLGVLPPEMRDDLPVLDISPDSLPAVLRGVLERPPSAESFRRYAERWHDPRQIALTVSEAYEAARGSRGTPRARGRGSSRTSGTS
jgi:glycosyltransferase involved in cell wall biosynthesis